MQGAKEKASDAAASARAGMEKTKATVQEKVEKMKTRDPAKKAMAEQNKEEKKREAELDKQITQEDNAEGRATRKTGVHHSTAGPGSDNDVTRTPVVGERIISGGTPPGHETGGRID